MSSILNGLSTLSNLFCLWNRAENIYEETMEIGKKFEKTHWSSSDYAETTLKVCNLVCDTHSFFSCYQQLTDDYHSRTCEAESKAIKSLLDTDNLGDIPEGTKNILSKYNVAREKFSLKDVKDVDEMISSKLNTYQNTSKEVRTDMKKVDGCSVLFAVTSKTIRACNSGGTILDALQDPAVLKRLGIAAGSLANASKPNSAIASVAKIVGNSNPEALLQCSYRFRANAVVLKFRREALSHDVTLPPQDLNYNTIPPDHGGDIVLAVHSCPITMGPIRFAVAIIDHNILHHYELAALYQWVAAHGTNPLTNEAVNLGDLIFDVRVQRIIENRMGVLGIPL